MVVPVNPSRPLLTGVYAFPESRGPRGVLLVGTQPQGGRGGVTPHPPLQTPKWLYGTMGFVGARAATDFVLGIRQGEFFCLTLYVYTQNTENFVENSKMDENHKKGF